MTGPKLNERNFIAGERSGTKASVRGSRMSASKARVVLNLIRGLDVVSADQVLQFTEREAARVVRKVLASAVANAINNDSLEAETLYVKACFADEGPTLRRFKPRARGRASRINKRTCHITIVLGVLDDDKLQIVQARRDRVASGRGAGRGGVASRRARVEASRTKRTGQAETEISSEAVADEIAPDDIAPDDIAPDTAVTDEVDETATEAAPAKKPAAKKAAADKKPAEKKPAAKKSEETN